MDQVVSKVKNELVDSVKYGSVYVSEFKNSHGLHYAVSIGYMHGGKWDSKELNVLDHELPDLIEALNEIHHE